MIDGFTKKYNLMFIEQMLVLVGIINGTIQSLVSLQNIKKVSIMIGIVIVGIDHIKEKLMIHRMVKLENYL